MKDPKSTVRYLGFQAFPDGSRQFDFAISRPDAGICYETLKCRIVEYIGTVPPPSASRPQKSPNTESLQK